jgi:hypothetical protein
MSEAICSQPGCPIAISGRCLEGFNPSSTCPYLARSELPQDEVASYNSQELVDLPSGEALSERQAASVTQEDPSKVIIIAGPFNSGKTTILTSLFEAFQEAPFGNFLFRGSRTLVGFERRSHLGREESGAAEPDTTHTSLREGVVFLHLALASLERGEFNHLSLLLSDISGELFRSVRDSSQAAKDLTVLGRADYLCIVIDGEKISTPEGRQIARNDSRSILRSIIEADSLAHGCVIDVAFTKWDIVVESIASARGLETREFIEATKAALKAIASSFEVRFHEIAARPSRKAKVPFAHGLPTLLRSWMGQASEQRVASPVYLPSAPSREFGRFTEAMLKQIELENVYDVRRL